MRVDFNFSLTILGFGEVFLELDANKFPFLSLFADFGGRMIFEPFVEIRVLV